jgi:type I restriction enzyme S subunit
VNCIPKADKLRPIYLRRLLQASHFRADLQSKASGTSGRKRVTPAGFLSLSIPLPTLPEQDALVAGYVSAFNKATQFEEGAKLAESSAWQLFEFGLGVTAQPTLPSRPIFVARFKDIESWNHEGVLRKTINASAPQIAKEDRVSLASVIDDLQVGWSPRCLDRQATSDEWGVLKLNAVTGGNFDDSAHKALPNMIEARQELEVRSGDVLITRGSGVTRLVGAAVYVETTRPGLMFPDLIFRVKFLDDSPILPRFLPALLRTGWVRKQIEERRTGAAPMMQKITKTALMGLLIPVPDVDIQRILIDKLSHSLEETRRKCAEATSLRQLAWDAFESALFESA